MSFSLDEYPIRPIMRLLVILSLLAASPAMAQLATFSFNAQIVDRDSPNGEISAALGRDLRTHIAWIRTSGDVRSLMYSVYDGTDVETVQILVPQARAGEVKTAPSIALDDQDRPHIAYFVKRDPDEGTRSGNYAVMYAGDPNGDGAFETSQVSTNPDDPTSNDESIYDAYVNGRPQVTIEAGAVTVVYTSLATQLNSFDRHVIFATRQGEGWERDQALNLDTQVGTEPSASEGLGIPQRMPSERVVSWIDISDYEPYYSFASSGWRGTVVSGFAAGTRDNSHVQIETRSDGSAYLFWFNDENGQFCRTSIPSGSPVCTKIQEPQGGQLFPSTIDASRDRFVSFYNIDGSSGRLLVSDPDTTYEVALNSIGVVYGKRVLNARDSHVSLVTASRSRGKIYVTTSGGTSTSRSGSQALSGELVLNRAHPNPASRHTNISYSVGRAQQVHVAVYDMTGRRVAGRSLRHHSPGMHAWLLRLEGLAAGLYLVRVSGETESRSQTITRLK